MLNRTGCAGLFKKLFCYIGGSCLPKRKIGIRICVDMDSALKTNMVQAGLVFYVVLYSPSISR